MSRADVPEGSADTILTERGRGTATVAAGACGAGRGAMTPFARGFLLRIAPAAPIVDLHALAGRGGVIVLAPHPDDETLGCGATLAAASAAGRDVHVVTVTDGAGSHPNSIAWPRARLAKRRQRELAAALDVLGRGRITHECLGYPDRSAPSPSHPGVPENLARLATAMRARRLDTVLTTWEGDPHVDHVRCAALAEALADRVEALVGHRPRVVRYPVWGRFVETSLDARRDELTRFATDASLRLVKRRALSRHVTQMTGLIDDDPDGFVMPAAVQRHFIEHDELFLSRRPA